MAVQTSTGMRFFTAGTELVRKTFDQLAQSGQKMWTAIASGQAKASPAMKGINAASKEVQASVAGMAASAGSAGVVLSAMGPYGVVAAAGVGGVVLALRQAKTAMEELGGLGETAAKIGVTTDALQKWRYVLEQTGGTAQDADAALKSFSEMFGGAMAGNKKSLKWFDALGFSQDDLKQLKTSSAALPEVTARIASLKSEDEQLFITGKLGIQALLPAIKEGQSAIDQMMQTAMDMGLIVDEQMIKRGKEAGDKYKTLADVIDVNLKKAFVDLAPALLAIVGLLADGARHLGVFANALKSREGRESSYLALEQMRISSRQSALVAQYGDTVMKPVPFYAAGRAGQDQYSRDVASGAMSPEMVRARQEYQRLVQEFAQNEQILMSRAKEHGATGYSVSVDSKGNPSDIQWTGGKGGTPTPTANPLKGYLLDLGTDRDAAQGERVWTAINRARERYLSALEKTVMSTDERLALELRGLEEEKRQRTEELARRVKYKELTQAQADQIAVEEQRARDAKEDQLREHAAREKKQAAAEYDGEMADMALELLRIEADMAVTVDARYELQKKALEAERASARKSLEFRLGENPNLTAEQRNAQLGRFDEVTKAQLGALNEQKNDARLMFRDAFRSGIYDALQSGNPLDLLKGFFSSLADSFTNRLSDRLADQLFNIFDSLMSELFSSMSSSGSSGFWGEVASGVASMFGYGHAVGGPTRAGALYPVNERGIEVFQSASDGYVLNHDQSVSSLASEVASAVARSGSGGGRKIDVNVRQEPGVAVEYVGKSESEIEIIARRILHSEGPAVVAADMTSSRNSVTSKAVRFGLGTK